MRRKLISLIIIFIFFIQVLSTCVIATEYVEFKDEKFRKAVLDSLGLDESHIITKSDMENLTFINVHDVTDYSPLKYAINLEEIYFYDTNTFACDLDFLNNCPHLKEVTFSHIGTLENVDVINNLEELYYVNLTFQEEATLKTAIPELLKINNTNINLAIQSNSDLETDKPEELIEDIAKIKVNRVYYYGLYKKINIEEPIVIGEEKTYTFNEINPWFEEYALNSNSVLYNPRFHLDSDDSNVLIDNENHTITITTDGLTENTIYGADINYDYLIQEDIREGIIYREGASHFDLSFTLINGGDTNKPIYIPDKYFKQLLLDNYDLDGDNKITQQDMNNVPTLFLLNIDNYTGLETAVNLEYLEVYNTINPINFSCYLLRNMDKLEDLKFRKLGNITYIPILNELPSLKYLEFILEDKALIKSIKLLNNSNVTLKVGLLNDKDNETIDAYAQELESVNVKRIFFANLYKDIEITEPIQIGKQKTYTFDELNPFISKYIQNKNSKMYNEDFEMYCSNPNVVIDNNKKTITIKSNEEDVEGEASVDVMYFYYIDGYHPDYTLKLKYSLAKEGAFDEEGQDILLGDIDKNGVVNATDYTMIVRYLKGYETLTEEQLLIADVDKNGTVNATDYTKIVRFLKGYEALE